MVVVGGRGPLVAAGVGEVVPGSQLVRLWRPTGPVHVLDKKKISILYLYIKEQPKDALKSTKKHKNSKKRGSFKTKTLHG